MAELQTATEDAPPAVPDRLAPHPHHRRWTVAVVLLLGLVLVLTAAVWAVLAGRSAGSEESDEQAALAAARQEAINLITTDPNRTRELFSKLVDGASGAFAHQLEGQSGAFVQAVQGAGVHSEGSVAEAGIVTADERRATVLLAANSRVRNAQVPGGEPRQYRMLLTLEKQGDAWLVSDLEFVP